MSNYLDYEQAKKFVRSHYPNVFTYTDWQTLITQIKRHDWPEELPRYPNSSYKNKGWKSWADFLGKEDEN